MNKKRMIVIAWFLVVLWMGVIFSFSNMNTNESNVKSKKTIEKVVDTTINTTNKIKGFDESVKHDKMENIVEKLNKPLRKCMHASVYFLLALLLIYALNISSSSFSYRYLLTILICFLYACTDEFHQLFVEGRTGQFVDVLIDTFGAIIGLLSYYIVCKLGKKVSINPTRTR